VKKGLIYIWFNEAIGRIEELVKKQQEIKKVMRHFGKP